MDMKRCEKGHFYDSERTPSCPYCNTDINGGINRPLNSDLGSKTVAISSQPNEIIKDPPLPAEESSISKTIPMNFSNPVNPSRTDNEKTVAIMRKDKGIDPVVGWLVCTEGADKGRDYRIRAERNFIGRSEKMDICIRGDDTISRESHAVISYDARKNTFRLFQGEGKGIVYHNDDEVITPVVLQPYDLIEMGKTKLVFIPLCGERFKWE